MPKEARARQTMLSDCGRYVTLDLPHICLLVHMYHTGCGPDLGEERYLYHLETLKVALRYWTEDRPDDKLFDDAVKNLIIATIEESKGVRYNVS